MGVGIVKVKQGNHTEGYSIFKSIIEDKYINSESLKVISGELGKAGLYEEAMELIEPLYNIQKHGIDTGLNMINVYFYSKHFKSAINLIKKLKKSDRVDIYNYLDEYKKKIDEVFSK